MTASTAFIVASALSTVFGIVYLPVLMKQPKAFVSPYAKADVRKRAAAAIADALFVASCVVLYTTQDSVLFIAAGALYLLFRDALFIPGQSIGKFLFGVRVISLAEWAPVQPPAFGSAQLHPARARIERRGSGTRGRGDLPRSPGTASRRYPRQYAGCGGVERERARDVAATRAHGRPDGTARQAAGGGEVIRLPLLRLCALAGVLIAAPAAVMAIEPEIVEFIFESAPFASAHASTIVETRSGLVAAWFGGTREGADDVGIWLSRRVSGKWTPPVEVATGVQSDGRRFPTWNPVLFELRAGELALFYKVGPNPREWWGMVRTSSDEGRTWSDGAAAARRNPGADQEQTRPSAGWIDHRAEQHRVAGLAERLARALRTHPRRRARHGACRARRPRLRAARLTPSSRASSLMAEENCRRSAGPGPGVCSRHGRTTRDRRGRR